MTAWDFLDKHANAMIRFATIGLAFAFFANDLSWDEARYMLFAGGAEVLTNFHKPTGG